MSTRKRFPGNSNIQWFDPPLHPMFNREEEDSLRFAYDGREVGIADGVRSIDDAVVGIAPDIWTTELVWILERAWRTEVGQAAMQLVRRRLTIYPTRGGAQSDADPWEDRPSEFPPGAEREARRLAATTGANARIWLDVGRPIDFSPGGGAEVRAPDSTFVHELVHAVNITWGNYRIHVSYPDPERRGAPSPEEEFAWLIENMYRSERRMGLRHRYLSERVRAPGTRSLGASLIEREVVALCWRRVRPLAQRLARIDARTCPYNPFREHARLAPGARP